MSSIRASVGRICFRSALERSAALMGTNPLDLEGIMVMLDLSELSTAEAAGLASTCSRAERIPVSQPWAAWDAAA